MTSSIEGFVLDSSVLASSFPEPNNTKIVYDENILNISEERTDANGCCSLKISLADEDWIEFRHLSLCHNHTGKGYERHIIRALILQCKEKKINLLSDYCYKHEIETIRFIVKELGLYEQCYSEDEEARDEEETPDGKCWSFNLTLK